MALYTPIYHNLAHSEIHTLAWLCLSQHDNEAYASFHFHGFVELQDTLAA